MPQDTSIYWNGSGQLPPEIIQLPPEQRQQVIEAIRAEQRPDQGDFYGPIMGAIFFSVFVVVAIYQKFKQNTLVHSAPILDAEANPSGMGLTPALLYSGNKLRFSDKVIAEILLKRFPYYSGLSTPNQEKFIQRLQKFMALKSFIIHDHNGFKEMPILISATAIQISFGLDKYLLPNFDTFNIYPGEFLRTAPFVRFLIGNVTGNTISLSWKHFLEGLKYPDDGQNVGMHEIAHALYYQTFVVEKHVDVEFRDTFIDFDSHGNKVYDLEKLGGPGLYSEYAMKDFQEFWAESVEIFFEKPIQMKVLYPSLYLAMSDLLNQNPANPFSTDGG
ncbi:MAG: zinc-dependent peptidase [Ferruginibacter sp.]|nr:zinc-dependent peptidase [Ferruginibacter sp.]